MRSGTPDVTASQVREGLSSRAQVPHAATSRPTLPSPAPPQPIHPTPIGTAEANETSVPGHVADASARWQITAVPGGRCTIAKANGRSARTTIGGATGADAMRAGPVTAARPRYPLVHCDVRSMHRLIKCELFRCQARKVTHDRTADELFQPGRTVRASRARLKPGRATARRRCRGTATRRPNTWYSAASISSRMPP